MTNRWKLKTSSSNILLVLNTLILVKAELAKGKIDNTLDYTNSIDRTKDENVGGDQTSIFVGNDEIARYFFSSSQNNNSTILEGINKCLNNFQLITCVKMLLLDKVNEAVVLTEEPSIQDADVHFLNGMVMFKLKNRTNDSAPNDIIQDLSLDEEITAKVKKIFWRRSLLVNVLPNVQIEIEPAPGKLSDFVCFTYKLRREFAPVGVVGQNEGRARDGRQIRLSGEGAAGKQKTAGSNEVTGKQKSKGGISKQKTENSNGTTNKKSVQSNMMTGWPVEYRGGNAGGERQADEGTNGDPSSDADDDSDSDADGDSQMQMGNRPGGNRRGGNRRKGNRRGGNRRGGNRCGGNRRGGNNDDNQRGNRGRGKSSGSSMLMMMPQMLMMGLMPFTLASLKAMVMNAVMINMMALNAAIFMTIRNLVFGPKKGDNVMYVNYGYEKDKQPKTKRPVLIIHSPAAFVKQPPLPRKPWWPQGSQNQFHGSSASNQNFYHLESTDGPWHQGTQNHINGREPLQHGRQNQAYDSDSWNFATQNQVQGNDIWNQGTQHQVHGSGPWQQSTQNQTNNIEITENPSNSDWQHFNPNSGSTSIFQVDNAEIMDADVIDSTKGDADVYYASPQIEHRRRWHENRKRYGHTRVNPFFKTVRRRVSSQ